MNLLRNAGFNFAGALIPAIALFVTIPVIVHRLGADAYGALVLITSIVGYFGIIDVNATAGSVKYVAEHQARGDAEGVNEVISFGLLLYGLLGLIGGAVLWFGADYFAHGVFKIPDLWRDEAALALKISALAFLVGQFQLYLQSVPQSLHRFDLSGQLDAAFGSVIPLVTIAVVLGGGGLAAIVAARLLVSVLHCALLLLVLRRLIPAFRPTKPRAGTMRAVGSFSAFAYLQRLAGVTYQNADKLLIGAQHSMLALATYVIPHTLLTRVFGMLFRLTQSMFPMASALAAVGELRELRRKYTFAARYSVYLNACVCLMCSLFAQEILHYWLGKGSVGEGAALVMVIVSYTMFIESLTNMPSLVNDGLGRPHITGVASLLRAGLGVGAAWWALSHHGIVALALSQLVVSLLLSSGFLCFVHRTSLPWGLRELLLPVYAPGFALLGLGSVVVACRAGSHTLSPGYFACFAIAVAVLLAVAGWCLVLSEEHRQRLLHSLVPWFGRA